MKFDRIDYNAPFTLTFTLVALVATVLGLASEGAVSKLLFITYAPIDWSNPLTYLRFFSHILGHASWIHFAANFTIILLIGPMLEEKFGSRNVTLFALVTALITGLAHGLLFNGGLLGASGIAFMFIVLSSLANIRSGKIPLTFILVAILYGGSELYAAFNHRDNISQFAHLVGGGCGALFGFLRPRK